jgi:tetratricopeptide (TPR) repeat protein
MSIAKDNKDFEKAIEYCNALLDLDSTNQRKWSEYIITLKADLNKAKINAELFENLTKQINSANYNEDWKTVISLCNEALTIKDDENIRNILRKAEAKYQIIIEQKAFEDSVSQIKSLIADKAFDKARTLTSELQKKYPEHNDVAKQLFRIIFEGQDSWSDKLKEHTTPKRNPIGFGQYNKSEEEPGQSFFDDDFPNKKQGKKQAEKVVSPKQVQPKKTNDDFFDMNVSTKKSENNSKVTKGLSNKDFDF